MNSLTADPSKELDVCGRGSGVDAVPRKESPVLGSFGVRDGKEARHHFRRMLEKPCPQLRARLSWSKKVKAVVKKEF